MLLVDSKRLPKAERLDLATANIVKTRRCERVKCGQPACCANARQITHMAVHVRLECIPFKSYRHWWHFIHVKTLQYSHFFLYHHVNMTGKRKDAMPEASGRDKKKQKTILARTIAVQPPGNSSQNAVAGSSKSVRFDCKWCILSRTSIRIVIYNCTAANALPGSLDIEKFAEVVS